jgi:signal transduction histidine kinase
VVRDTTERWRVEEELRELNRKLEASNRDLEAFGHTVSHDLHTPLRAIRGFGGALLEECGAQLDEVATDYLERVLRAGERMESLIDDLLMVSRASRSSMTSCSVDLARYAREAAIQLRLLEPDRRVELRCPERIDATGDPTLLRLCIENLVGNAFKFSRPRCPSRIEVGTLGGDDPSAAESSSIYFVRDNGVGFDMRHVDRVFRLFERLHRADEFGGTGVGLAIVQRVVERHGGRVWIESQPDHGTTVYFTLGR